MNLMQSLLFGAGLVAASSTFAAVKVGEAAPNFTLTGADGKSYSLKDFAGKKVVLEWHNPQCPFVKKFYSVGEMQRLQVDAKAGEVVWLSINSGAQGKQGHLDAAGANAMLSDAKASPAAYLLDANGEVGKSYGAKTTPHMYVIDPAGKIAYMGAIDSNPSADSADIKGATNYVVAAIDAVRAGQPVAKASTQPYGCSVKY
jgi:peroxiredoxin